RRRRRPALRALPTRSGAAGRGRAAPGPFRTRGAAVAAVRLSLRHGGRTLSRHRLAGGGARATLGGLPARAGGADPGRSRERARPYAALSTGTGGDALRELLPHEQA